MNELPMGSLASPPGISEKPCASRSATISLTFRGICVGDSQASFSVSHHARNIFRPLPSFLPVLMRALGNCPRYVVHRHLHGQHLTRGGRARSGKPGRNGSSGCKRSSARPRLFSSKQSPHAWSGGLVCRPTTSRTLATWSSVINPNLVAVTILSARRGTGVPPVLPGPGTGGTPVLREGRTGGTPVPRRTVAGTFFLQR